jgi:hypothetical protein
MDGMVAFFEAGGVLASAPWHWTSATWAGLTFVVLTAAALIGWWQVRESRRLREAQARPFVIVDLEVGTTIAELKITNIGRMLARDVSFRFEPRIQSSWDSDPGQTPLAETNLLTKGIPSLPPGKVIRTLFDRIPDRLEEGLPDDYEVEVTYRGPFRKRFSRNKPYVETMTVGVSFLRETGWITRHDIDDVYKRLEELVREVKKWTVVGSAIQVMTPEDVERHHDKLEARRAERRAEQASDAAEGGTNGEV